MEGNPRVLVVDDEKIALSNLQHILQREGYEVTTTQSGQEALRMVTERSFDAVLTDLKMEKVDGIQLLKKCKETRPDTEVILITGYATLETAINAMKYGAYDYIAKPFKIEEVRAVLREAIEKVRLKRENAALREQLEQYEGEVRLIAQHHSMQGLLETARQIAPTDCNVIISGESGTGKELLARYLHTMSSRAGETFFAVNCGAFTEDLLASELFGHERGAFTGAVNQKKGIIELASRGTLFLDEITEMPPSMQVKLLRVIQEREVLRVGGTEPIEIDVRFVAATNRNLTDAIDSGHMRRDLYYRLNVVTLHLPPLCERREDIPILCFHFLRKYSTLMKKPVSEIAKEAQALLMSYDFPGNVRELENIIERGVALSNGNVLEVAHLPQDIKELSVKTFRKKDGKYATLEDQEFSYIKWVLDEVGGNKTLAAGILGIDRVSLWRKLKKLGMDDSGTG